MFFATTMRKATNMLVYLIHISFSQLKSDLQLNNTVSETIYAKDEQQTETQEEKITWEPHTLDL